jgi:hypothetical protein
MSRAESPPRVLLDACVLADFIVSDLLLRLAETPALIAPRWSEAILEETNRAHLKFNRPPASGRDVCLQSSVPPRPHSPTSIPPALLAPPALPAPRSPLTPLFR